ncbi:MAG: serine/threonine-protein kinase [Gemmataceae bacterium]
MTVAAPQQGSLIEELLLQWQDARDRGHSRTAEELCRDHPDLLDQLRGPILALEAMYARFGLDRPTPGSEGSTATESTHSINRLTGIGVPPDIPGYDSLILIGEGGMGSVYRARQLGLQRFVAIKMIRAGRQARADQLTRFAAEAEAVARLRHPNIVQIYEVGQWQGQPYFSMEYVAEGTLAERLTTGLIPPRIVAEWVRTLAEAMQHAHSCGVIHRDLKPANILLRRKADASKLNDAVEPLISDFGLAKFLDEESTTRTGTVLGTPQYLAPEQVDGPSSAVGPAADVHALGVVLYEMLAGRPPYLGTSAMEILEQVRRSEPVPPSRLQPQIPAELEVISLKCLAKEPARRYPTAAALADDMGRYLRGEPILARRTSFWQRAFRWACREPWLAGLATLSTVALLALVAMGVGFTLELRRAAARLQNERDEAEMLKTLAEEGQRKAEAEKNRSSYLLMRCMTAIDEHAQATEQSREMKVRTGDPGSIPYVVARLYAASAKVYQSDTHLSETDRALFSERYARKSVELLHQAAAHGYFDADHHRTNLRADPDLAILHDRADFQALLKKHNIPLTKP